MTCDICSFQSPKHHLISVLITPQKGEKNSLVISFKQPADNAISISSEVSLFGITNGPVTLDIESNLAMRDMRV